MRKKGYDPNQPRVPAGQPGGGQWTSDGSGAGNAARKSAGLKSNIEKFGERISREPIEHSGTFDDDGHLIQRIDGTNNQVVFTPQEARLMNGRHTVHNHPDHDNASFSIPDLNAFVVTNQKSMLVYTTKYKFTLINNNWKPNNFSTVVEQLKWERAMMYAQNHFIEKAGEIVSRNIANGKYPDCTHFDMMNNTYDSWNINHYFNEVYAKERGWTYKREEWN